MPRGKLTAEGAWRNLVRDLEENAAVIFEKDEHGFVWSFVPKGYRIRIVKKGTEGLKTGRRSKS